MTQAMQYHIRDPQGSIFGPASIPTIHQWICEGRIHSGMMLAPEGTQNFQPITAFPDLAAMEEVLTELMTREPPLITRLSRQPGRKEARYAHLFSGEPELAAEEGAPPPEAARLRVMAGDERMAKLEEEVALLRTEVAELRKMMAEFSSQFE